MTRAGSEQGEGLAGPLGVPDEAATFRWLGAAFHDAVNGAALMLAQHRLAGLSILDVEEDPVPHSAQEVGGLKERLDGEPVAFLGAFLPARHVAARGVPGYSVPVI